MASGTPAMTQTWMSSCWNTTQSKLALHLQQAYNQRGARATSPAMQQIRMMLTSLVRKQKRQLTRGAAACGAAPSHLDRSATTLLFAHKSWRVAAQHLHITLGALRNAFAYACFLAFCRLCNIQQSEQELAGACRMASKHA